MREHRLIEKMVENLGKELDRVREGRVNPVFVDTAVDFFRTYADRTHHGKEEDILFRELNKKQLRPEHKAVMDELISEHIVARHTVRGLLEAKNRVVSGEKSASSEVERRLIELIALYPSHIEKEDKRFFYPIMDYFSNSEREAMLQEFIEFDRNMIHEKYGGLVESAKTSLPSPGLMRCKVCGYLYDPSKGDPEHGVKAGTLFVDLPPSWVCPICFAKKEMFEKV